MLIAPSILPQAFYREDTKSVAQALLGKVLCHRKSDGRLLMGRIVETEAYLGVDDPACHTFKDKKSAKNRSMYLDGGHAYIYVIYGMHYCLNLVTRTPAHPEAVLLRAIEPIGDAALPAKRPAAKANLESNGPGKLCRYLGLTKEQDGVPVWNESSGLWVLDAPPVPTAEVAARPRIGVDYAGEAAAWPLRYYVIGNRYVSKQ